MNRGERQRIARNTRVILAERFPLCFMRKREVKRPLKLGILQDVWRSCPGLAPQDIKLALDDYCSGPRYLSQMTEGAPRVALDGTDEGVVTATQAAMAKGQLARFLKRFPQTLVTARDIENLRPSDSEAAA